MTEKLKPCPFCGGEAELRTIGKLAYVECSICHCQTDGVYYKQKKEEIKRWNNRLYPWHMGRPTEDGEYVCTVKINTTGRDGKPFESIANHLFTFKDGYETNNYIGEPHEIIRYLKVEPYKEGEE